MPLVSTEDFMGGYAIGLSYDHFREVTKMIIGVDTQ